MNTRFWLMLIGVGLLFLVVYPLWVPLAMGGVFAALFYPLQAALHRRRVPPRFTAILLTAAIALLILIPAAVLIYIGARETLERVQEWRNAPQTVVEFARELFWRPGVQRVIEWVSTTFFMQVDEIFSALQDVVRSLGIRAADWIGALAGTIPAVVVGLTIMVLSIYFFLAEGHDLQRRIHGLHLLEKREMERIFKVFVVMSRSVILASVASGFMQALVFGISCAVAGVPNATTIGALVLVASFIPVLGSSPLTFGVALYMLLTEHHAGGIALLIVAALLTVLDNVVRSLFLKGSTNLHPLLAFVAALGGLQFLGVLGIFLGPVMVGLALVLMEIYADRSTHS